MTSAGLWAFIGCTNEVDSNRDLTQLQLSGTTAPKDPRLPPDGASADKPTDKPTVSPLSMASGYLVHQRSFVTPWCGAVLVDPSTALTAAHCVVDVSPRNLSLGFGALGAGTAHAVSSIQVHPLYQQGETTAHDIARLILTEPVREVVPMGLATQVAEQEKVSVVSYVFVPAGHEGERRVFDGAAQNDPDGGLSAVFAGADTNCHGEGGAGLYRLAGDSTSSELLGIASGGSYDPPHPIYPSCLGRLNFAPMSANLDFIASPSP